LEEICFVAWGKAQKGKQSGWKLLLWTAVASILFGLVQLGELPEDMLRVARNKLHSHDASGDIVFVAVDDSSLREVGRWPWPRRKHAELIDRLSQAGAKRTFLDIILHGRSDAFDDSSLVGSIEKARNVTLAVSPRSGITGDVSNPDLLPPDIFSQGADLGLINFAYNYQSAVWRVDYSRTVNGQNVPSFAAKLAGAAKKPGQKFIIDYSIDPASIPVIAAADILAGRFDPESIKGKDVIIGTSSEGWPEPTSTSSEQRPSNLVRRCTSDGFPRCCSHSAPPGRP
jgi:CHASE2 domain-containing sensor protein